MSLYIYGRRDEDAGGVSDKSKKTQLTEIYKKTKKIITMKNIKDFGSFVNESAGPVTPEEPLYVGATVGDGYNVSKPLDTIKKIPGVKETKLKDGTSQITYTDPQTKVDIWVFYNNGRAYNLQTNSMYSYYFKEGFIDFKKDAKNTNSGAPVKVGEFVVVTNCPETLNQPYFTGSGTVQSLEKDEDGFWSVVVKGDVTGPGGKSKSGRFILNSQYHSFRAGKRGCAATLNLNSIF